MESSLKNMIVVLGAVTLVAAAAVGGVFLLTEEPIAQAQKQKINNAIAAVMPDFANEPAAEATEQIVEGTKIKIYPAKGADGVVAGYAIETFSKNGFGGMIRLLVGFLPDGTIQGISVIEQKETPGLGDKIEPAKSNFSVQFIGKHPDKGFKLAVRKDGGDVDAITASTISSRAYTEAVARAYTIFQTLDK